MSIPDFTRNGIKFINKGTETVDGVRKIRWHARVKSDYGSKTYIRAKFLTFEHVVQGDIVASYFMHRDCADDPLRPADSGIAERSTMPHDQEAGAGSFTSLSELYDFVEKAPLDAIPDRGANSRIPRRKA